MYITAGSFLRVTARASVGPLACSVLCMVKEESGDVYAHNSVMTVAAGAVLTTQFFPLNALAIYGVGFSTPITADSFGWCAVTIDVVRGGLSVSSFEHRIYSGLVPPGGVYIHEAEFGTNSGSNPGTIVLTQGASPAVAASASWSQTTFAVQELLAVRCSLTTDANVANRFVSLTIQADLTTIYKTPGFLAQTAGQTVQYNFAQGAQAITSAGELINEGLPKIGCSGMMTVTFIATSMQAGDQFGAPLVQFRSGSATQLQLITIPS